jgi:hypothetical protein
MSFFDCVQRAVDGSEADKRRGEAAQEEWRRLKDRYRGQGHSDEMADALAAEDVKAAFKKQAGDDRHRFQNGQLRAIRKIMAEVENSPDLSTLGTSKIERLEGRANDVLTVRGQVDALRRLFHYRLAALAKKHHRDMLGNNKAKAGLANIMRELHGESTGDLASGAIAKAYRQATQEMRRMFNEFGGTIGDLADWGLPHVHNSMAITKAGFDQWYGDIHKGIAWDRIEDFLTGKPMAPKGAMPSQERMKTFLREIYDNLAFSKESADPAYGKPLGQSLISQHAQHRVLHFKSSDDWMSYNKLYGTGDVFGSMIAHAHRMAEDIIALKEFGPSWEAGLEFQKQTALSKARRDGQDNLADKIRANHDHARSMMRIMRGGQQPISMQQAASARFFSSTRHVMSPALLDRAVIASISDTNTMRMAAKSMGMQQFAPFKRHMQLLVDGAEREVLAQAGWIADTLFDPGLILARWQSDVPPADLAERVSSFVMRAQGLAHWTDTGRMVFQSELSGLFARNAGRRVADVDEKLRPHLLAKGVTDEEWSAFTRPEHMFTAPTGAVFASPMWWRQSTDLPATKADEIFLKMQSIIEEQTEYAVPTQSLWARAGIEGDSIPGTIPYEIGKSALMMKSFPMTFTVNQVARIMAQRTPQGRVGYAFDLIAGSTIMGAVALQLGEALYGRDPQDMTDPSFWARAALKGGGFGVVGDLVAAGESSWGGGFGSYLTGPMPQLVGDVWNLSVGNAIDAMSQKDVNLGRDFVRFLDRWTPGADLPVAGLAIDRMFWDSLMHLLDPEAEKWLTQNASRRENLYGNASWWNPGSALPSRAPNPAAAFGG